MTLSWEEGQNWNAFNNSLVYGGVTVAHCQTTDDAQFAVYLLWERGIKSGILLPSSRMDLRIPRVRVAPEDEIKAVEILQEPLNAGKRVEYDSDPEIEIPPAPFCPKCEKDCAVLDGIVGGNQWRCEDCGSTWTEFVTDPGE